MISHSRRSGLPALLLLALAAALPACGARPAADDDRVVVTTSVLPHAGLVERIGGARVRVIPLVGRGESASTHQPSDAQVSRVLGARIYFRTGVPFEHGAWLDLLARTPSLEIVDLREGLDLRPIEAHGGGHPDHGDALDPHIWTAPRLLLRQAETIKGKLQQVDPGGEHFYQERFEAVAAELRALDAELRALLEPARGKRFYVFHPAWGYFCDAYGITQRAIEIEGKEPSESEVTDLVRDAKADGVRAVFVQSQITGRTARAIADLLDARLIRLDPLAEDPIRNLREVGTLLATWL